MDSYEVLNESILSMQRTVNAQHNEIIDLKARLAALEHFVERTFPNNSKFVAYGTEQPKK